MPQVGVAEVISIMNKFASMNLGRDTPVVLGSVWLSLGVTLGLSSRDRRTQGNNNKKSARIRTRT